MSPSLSPFYTPLSTVYALPLALTKHFFYDTFPLESVLPETFHQINLAAIAGILQNRWIAAHTARQSIPSIANIQPYAGGSMSNTS
jgi:hypothetical protein